MGNNYVLEHSPFKPYDRNEHVAKGLKALGDVPCRAVMLTREQIEEAILDAAARESERLRAIEVGL